ncbi:hypothetical protein B0H13DRAFT_2531858 [Mycena leptocephala]|nr:hypothetical protein B0H13DRAFT_2531858 [Mycena leptocephala]
MKMRCWKKARKRESKEIKRDWAVGGESRAGLVPAPAAYDQEHTPTSHAAACMLPERHRLVTWSPISGVSESVYEAVRPRLGMYAHIAPHAGKDPWIGRGGMQWRGCVRTTSSRVIDESAAIFEERVKKSVYVGPESNSLALKLFRLRVEREMTLEAAGKQCQIVGPLNPSAVIGRSHFRSSSTL